MADILQTMFSIFFLQRKIQHFDSDEAFPIGLIDNMSAFV